MKIVFLFGLLALTFFTRAQSFKSALYADNPGVYALGSMPSLLVDRNTKWDIQLAGVQFNFFNSDNTGQTIAEELKSSLLSSNPKKIFAINSSNAFVVAQLALPHISYAINENNAIGFSASIRSFTYQNNSGFSLYDIIQDVKKDRSFSGGYLDEFMIMFSNNWMEFGLTYSRNIDISKDWSLQAGITTRYLSGIASGELQLDGFNGNFLNSQTDNLSASISLVYNEAIDQIIEDGAGELDLFSKNGYSIDLGFSTKWKDKLTVGFSILDMGSIKYIGSKESSVYEIEGESLDLESFTELKSVSQLADSIESQIQIEGEGVNSFKAKIPLKVLFYGNYSLNNTFGIVGSVQLTRFANGLSQDRHNVLREYNIAPIIKFKKATISLPFSYSGFSNFRSGLGLQWRFLTLGSDTLLSYFLSNPDTKSMNVYFSFRAKIGKFK